MLGNNHGSPYDHPSKVFRGVRFVILGFDPLNKAKVLKKLVDGGGVDAGHYGPNCTHVIVDNLAYDDPICIVARSDGKTLVSGLWIDHSFDVGMPVDSTSVMYRPLKDLNGIPGAKSLIICLTGYQRQDRDDIMTMVGLMGANFSKPLVANKVTHLICYKFEGEKYELAKKIKRIKLVNHRWLEDCLKAWEIVPEADYDKSGYELETLEAEAKDSEDEANGYATKNYAERAASPHQPLVLKQEVLLNSSASKGFGKSMDMVSATAKITSDQAPNPHERQSKHPVSLGFCDTGSLRDVLCDPSYPYNKMEISAMSGNDFASTSEGTKKSPHSDAEKFSALSYLRNTPRRTTPSMYSGETASNLNSTTKLVKLNLGDGFHIASSVTEQATDGTGLVGFRTPSKGFALCPEEDQYGSFSAKRKMDISGGSSKLQKTIHNTKAHVLENPIVASGAKGSEHVFLKDGPVETINRPSPDNDASYSNEIAALNPAQNSPSNITARKSLSSNRKLLTCDTPISKTTTSESMQGENVEALQTSLKGFRTATLGTKPEIQNVGLRRPEHAMDEDQELRSDLQEVEIPSPSIKRLDIEKSNSSSILEINGGSGESHSKSVGRKMVGKKFLGPKLKLGNGKTANQKGSVYLKNSASRNNADQETADCDKFVNSETFDRVPSAANFDTEIEMEKNDVLHSKILAENKSVCMDDETEPPEDKEETVREKYQEIEQDNIVDMVTEEKSEGGLHQIDQNDEKGNGRAERESSACGEKNQMEKSANLENHVNVKKTKGKKRPSRKLKKDTTLSERDKVADIVTEEKSEAELHKTDQNDDKDIARTVYKSSACGDKNQVKSAIMEDLVSEKVARGKKRSSGKIKKNTVLSVSQPSDKKAVNKEEFASEQKNEKLEIKEPHSAGKTKTIATVNDLENTKEAEKENHLKKIIPKAGESVLDSMQGEFVSKTEPVWFILSGHRLQRKEFQKVIRGLKGRVCRDSHQWSYQATHLIVPDPIRRTEKFFAAAASGRWILKTDYLSASIQAGKFLAEEPYEWHKNGLTEDGAINLEAPRKWRLLKEKMGCGAFHGMKIIVYGECIAPPLDTLKRAVKAGDGTILATSPPYTRFLNSGVDFAVVSPGMPRVDMWVQEFLRHEIPCVVADYLVEYVCKTGYPLERHVQYSTHAWAEKSFMKLKDRLEEIVEPSTPENSNNNDIPCDVCGLGDRGDVMLICGDEIGSTGCGVGTHIDCCDLPLENVPEEDWFCPKCSKSKNSKTFQKGTKRKTSVGKRR